MRRHALKLVALALTLVACSTGPVAQAQPLAPGDARQGRQVYALRNCSSCHSIDGSRDTGPTWLGLAGTTERLTDGTTEVVDRDYIIRSIREPQSQVVDGFDVVRMPAIDLSDQEIEDVVAFIESLGS